MIPKSVGEAVVCQYSKLHRDRQSPDQTVSLPGLEFIEGLFTGETYQ
jgi:hypothetical protein